MKILQMLKARLSEEDFDLVEMLYDLQSDSSSLHSALSFIQGYKIGALMMIDVFSDKDSVTKEYNTLVMETGVKIKLRFFYWKKIT
ncbi:DUF6809 family protein [Paenibacillus phytohabitans]|uniref:DUF6809 family protein n=1 Tax=Paenibacillus phytohabitans TaxID=2654978 RepID=UPI003AB428FF